MFLYLKRSLLWTQSGFFCFYVFTVTCLFSVWNSRIKSNWFPTPHWKVFVSQLVNLFLFVIAFILMFYLQMTKRRNVHFRLWRNMAVEITLVHAMFKQFSEWLHQHHMRINICEYRQKFRVRKRKIHYNKRKIVFIIFTSQIKSEESDAQKIYDYCWNLGWLKLVGR